MMTEVVEICHHYSQQSFRLSVRALSLLSIKGIPRFSPVVLLLPVSVAQVQTFEINGHSVLAYPYREGFFSIGVPFLFRNLVASGQCLRKKISVVVLR